MLPIVRLPSFVENILPRFSLIFNKAQLRHFGKYLTGLMVSENKTVTGINNTRFLNHTVQSSKNHFLTIGDKCRIASAEILRSFIFWAYQHFNQENDVDQVFRIAMKGNPQLKLAFLIEKSKFGNV